VASWLPPPAGLAKFSVDAVVSRSGNRGVGGEICRDDQGIYLGASTVVFSGISDPTTFESLACREALALADDLVLSCFKVASDCKVMVTHIRRHYRKVCIDYSENQCVSSAVPVVHFGLQD
jgi:hypothetical protein